MLVKSNISVVVMRKMFAIEKIKGILVIVGIYLE